MATIPVFYKKLRDLCEERGITVNELARLLELSTGSPTAWKNGTVPRAVTLDKIASYFGVSVDYLIDEKAKEAPTNGERSMNDDDLKFALWGDCQDIDEADLEDVRRYAAFVRERKKDRK